MAQSKDTNFNKPQILYCQYCGKECKNLNSLKQHECRCGLNPSRKAYIINGFNTKGKSAWNSGLTKDTDTRVLKASVTFAVNQAAGKHTNFGRKHTEEEKQHLRDCALKSGLGGFHMRRGIFYNGIKLDSSYEVTLAEDLDRNSIIWTRPARMPYIVDNKLHYYTADFYLPDFNIYLDPKNDFLINNVNSHTGISDLEKIKLVEKYNNVKIFVLNKDQLSWEYIKNYLI